VYPGGQFGGQVEGLAGGDHDQAVRALGHQGGHLRDVGGVVQDDRHRQAGQLLVVQLAQPLDLLVGGGTFAEEQLLAGRAEPVEQVQQGVAGGQRGLARAVAAQIHHAGTAEVVPQIVRGPHREGGAPRARRAVQHDHGRPGLRTRAGRLHQLPNAGQLHPPPGERAHGIRKLTERLLQHTPPARRRALVRTAQLRPRLLRRPGGGGEHPLLVQERPDAPHLQRRQPLQPQLLGATGLARGTGAVMRGGQMGGGHLHDGRRRTHDADGHPGTERRTGVGAEGQVGHHGGDRGNTRHQQGSSPPSFAYRCPKLSCPAAASSSAPV
jgi:hypothetical protein